MFGDRNNKTGEQKCLSHTEKGMESAFKKMEFSEKEQHLVAKLRNSTGYIRGLSLVAVKANNVIGHILLRKIVIQEKKKLNLMRLLQFRYYLLIRRGDRSRIDKQSNKNC